MSEHKVTALCVTSDEERKNNICAHVDFTDRGQWKAIKYPICPKGWEEAISLNCILFSQIRTWKRQHCVIAIVPIKHEIAQFSEALSPLVPVIYLLRANATAFPDKESSSSQSTARRLSLSLQNSPLIPTAALSVSSVQELHDLLVRPDVSLRLQTEAAEKSMRWIVRRKTFTESDAPTFGQNQNETSISANRHDDNFGGGWRQFKAQWEASWEDAYSFQPREIAQLGAMLRSMGGMAKDNPSEDADRIEVALNHAEELIRKKKDYGTELGVLDPIEENAVNLAYGLAGLQDKYNLDGFNELRQNARNALVACSPRKAAPCIIEEFSKNQYSTEQRFVMLNAVALGARELASLPTQTTSLSDDSTSFPSKRLPGPLHRKYLPSSATLPRILSGITRQTIDRGKEATEDKVPEIVRERRFRVQRTKHEQTREARTAYHEGRTKYHGAGTGLILNSLVMTHFLRTLTVLVHASENTPEWLGFLAPDSLELALTLGTKLISIADSSTEDTGIAEKGTKEASVLASALELALIVLDGCIQLDGGRSLGLDQATLLMSVTNFGKAIGAAPLDDVCRHLRPRYHFAASAPDGSRETQPVFSECQPFVWDGDNGNGNGQTSRFISLGVFNGPAPWFYAFFIEPGSASSTAQKPKNASKNPFTETLCRKRPFEEVQSSQGEIIFLVTFDSQRRGPG
ncbi:telomere length regulation protein-domain-containing protein [Lentinula edodes]|nr:telomere length regulation protein-domain-containing protein [Lentinula edodes]